MTSHVDTTTHLLASPAARHWSRVGIHAHHGINLPLFSLHSEHSGGIGEFLDLIPLIDWCQRVGLDIIQLLPLNDSGPCSSPYSALSAFALHPIYLSLSALEGLPTFVPPPAEQRVNYPEVWRAKEPFLRQHYSGPLQQLLNTEAFQNFENQNPWLLPYAVFKAIKESRNWEPWMQWPEALQNPQQLPALYQEHREAADFHKAVQFLCFEQMQSVKAHATRKGVSLKGDLPILISPESADVWAHQDFFDTHYSAGAPPDRLNADGQDWGFPIYNWKLLEEQNFGWWKQRLKVAERCYHLYRLDHAVGFYRIWAHPLDRNKPPHFIPEDRQEWLGQGEAILRQLLESSLMLPIAEDLGTIPPEVPKSLHRLGIPGTKVLRWERDWEGNGHFLPPDTFPPGSLTTVSTHDTETLPQWWRCHPEDAQTLCLNKGWAYHPHLEKGQLLELLHDSHQSASLFHINLLQEYLALIPNLHWGNPEDDQVNVPGTQSPSNWTYRFRPSVETLVENQELARLMQSLTRKDNP